MPDKLLNLRHDGRPCSAFQSGGPANNVTHLRGINSPLFRTSSVFLKCRVRSLVEDVLRLLCRCCSLPAPFSRA